MSWRELTSDSGEQRISCGPEEEILTRYRSHFPSLFHLGQWMRREASAGDFHKLFICGIKRRAAVLLWTDVNALMIFKIPRLGGTHSEHEVNQTSDLLLRLHGTFTLHKASKGDLIRLGFSVEDSQKYFHTPDSSATLIVSKQWFHTLTHWLTVEIQWWYLSLL